MRVCLDANVLVQIFTSRAPFPNILDAVIQGQITLLVSNEILLEYEEVISREFGPQRWRKVESLLATISALHGSIIHVEPQYRFAIIASDPDDNKFADCAIAGHAAFILTYDAHFEALRNSGYKPQPITPEELVALTTRP